MRSWWRILFVRMIHLQRWADQLNSANKPALCTVHYCQCQLLDYCAHKLHISSTVKFSLCNNNNAQVKRRPFPSVHCVHNKGEMKLSEHWPVINQILTSGHNNNQTSPKLLNCNSSDLSAVGSLERSGGDITHYTGLSQHNYCSIIW